MLPSSPCGSPGLCVSSVHCSPPSVDLKIPPPGPPETSCHGLRCAYQKAAYSTSGLEGSSTRSVTPVESLRNSTLCHDLPPSVLLYTPRSAFGPNACPCAPTHTMSGFAGCTRTREICCVSARPTNCHFLPPSVVLNTPPPVVPIQYSFGRDAEPATATERPPRKMPISRHFSAANTVESYGVACADAGRGSEGERTVARATTAAASGSGRADTGR